MSQEKIKSVRLFFVGLVSEETTRAEAICGTCIARQVCQPQYDSVEETWGLKFLRPLSGQFNYRVIITGEKAWSEECDLVHKDQGYRVTL